ncbi:uncharacterized protein LOC124890843 [Capsicum annuum]|uniref:uncharacterized protein LOC124890843 n=1 Tax=Capsicum annuum TaxID=4072 RepID=UPI001FB083F9|nr:uncharacterized protein LOC124890843 [Capsicum annuum]
MHSTIVFLLTLAMLNFCNQLSCVFPRSPRSDPHTCSSAQNLWASKNTLLLCRQSNRHRRCRFHPSEVIDPKFRKRSILLLLLHLPPHSPFASSPTAHNLIRANIPICFPFHPSDGSGGDDGGDGFSPSDGGDDGGGCDNKLTKP